MTEGTAGSSWHDAAWMQTFTGKQFRPFTAKPEDIDPEDIAHALSMICRYGGHSRRFYSVAEHCVLMANYALEDASPEAQGRARETALWCLLHDAAEAYIGDMVRPLKVTPRFGAYRELDDKLTAAIAVRFDAPVYGGKLIPDLVKSYDSRILLDERAAVLTPPPQQWDVDEQGLKPLGVQIRCWSPGEAESEYLRLLTELLP